MATKLGHLRGLFDRLRDGLEKMLALLEQEAACLEARDASGMERIAGEKLRLAPQLEEMAGHHREHLDLGDAEAGVEWLLDGAGGTVAEQDALRDQWRHIVRLTQACRRQNGINGAYIGLLRRHVEGTLQILAGAAAGEATYGPDGATRRGGLSRHSFSV